MPEQVAEFPKPLRPNAVFDPLVDGAIWRFAPDEWRTHFKSIESFKASAHHYGKTRGYAVKVLTHDGATYVRFTGTRLAGVDRLTEQRRVKRQKRIAGTV